MQTRELELLSPAANADIAIQAILHGADAVYIGPPSHGARKSAANSIEDIERVVDFARQYRAKVYATVNTIVYDDEIKRVESLCRDLYHAGVDALIIQDMGILRMKIPPIALHASTQCDIRTPEKALFLQKAGFSQLVLARELTLKEIRDITSVVSVPVETFIHGALCVSYSGRCHASWALSGRSANRGECAQVCRYPFTLSDASGKIIERDKYLLSLKDFNASHKLEDLIEAGVSSFKIEGRLKDMAYVKNITALYNNLLDGYIAKNPTRFKRASFGNVSLKFTPQADKSFNRGFTDYFLGSRKPPKIASLLTPKSMGEPITDRSILNNGDGISYFDEKGKFTGVHINRMEGNKIIPARKVNISGSTQIYRTSDIQWDKTMNSPTASRKIPVDVEITDSAVILSDSRGLRVEAALPARYEEARNKPDYRPIFEKLGNTPYCLNEFKSSLPPSRFYPASELTLLRRELISRLDEANKATYPHCFRAPEDLSARFPYTRLEYADNVANRAAREFYVQHGADIIENAAEVSEKLKSGDTVMTTRHCILRELGICKKEKGNPKDLKFPLYLNYEGGRFRLDFDCNACEMKVVLP